MDLPADPSHCSAKSFQVVRAWSFGRKSQLSLPKTHPHELMVKYTSIHDATASGGISGRLSITLSTKPKSLAISAVIK
jgi:hypothetical protein